MLEVMFLAKGMHMCTHTHTHTHTEGRSVQDSPASLKNLLNIYVIRVLSHWSQCDEKDQGKQTSLNEFSFLALVSKEKLSQDRLTWICFVSREDVVSLPAPHFP